MTDTHIIQLVLFFLTGVILTGMIMINLRLDRIIGFWWTQT